MESNADSFITVSVHTTLIRDQNGLGFSIAGGKGSPPFKAKSDVSFKDILFLIKCTSNMTLRAQKQFVLFFNSY